MYMRRDEKEDRDLEGGRQKKHSSAEKEHGRKPKKRLHLARNPSGKHAFTNSGTGGNYPWGKKEGARVRERGNCKVSLGSVT